MHEYSFGRKPMTTLGKSAPRHLLIFVLLMTTSAFSASLSSGQNSGRSPLKTVIHVTADPQTLPLNYKTVEALILSNRNKITGPVDMRDILTLTPLSTADKSPVLISLDIHLPENSKTMPQEVLAAVTAGLQKALMTIHQAQIDNLNSQLATAKRIRAEAEKRLTEAIRQGQSASTERIEFDPADKAVYTQLKQRIDLSWLNPNMIFSEAIERLRQSVTPPLNITVLWKDLLDNAEIQTNTLTEHLELLHRRREDILSENKTARESLGLPEKEEQILDGPFVMKEMLLARMGPSKKDQADIAIANLERLLGPQQLDPDISRIRWAARQIEQANAHIAALEKQIADEVTPIVTVIAGGDAQNSMTSSR